MHRALALPSLAAWTAACVAGLKTDLRLRPTEAIALNERWKKRWARGALWHLDVRVHRHGAVARRHAGGRLIVANHRLPMDIPVLLRFFGGEFLSRADLAHWPLLGPLAQQIGTIFVDRQSKQSGVVAIRAMRRRLQAGASIIAFPEGTTHAGDEVHPFRGGAFSAAKDMPVQIVPVGLAYDPGTEFVGESFPEHIRRIASIGPLHVGVAIGVPIELRGSTHEVASVAHAEVAGLTVKARALWRHAQRR